ncbi:zinc finger protein 883-like [Ochlerotatus camptorhynchus]|uniref:zinc finger protein 883-like n=1 Tax=Ochlerotatus camptorhynchus TaxID=644619 RepID=UPI0031DDC24B
MNNDDGFDAVSVAKLSLAFTCRTCLNTNSDEQLTSIFEGSKASGKFDLLDQLLLLNLKIVKDDGYPENICSICMQRLETIDAFRKQCEKAQEYLEQNCFKVPEDKPKCNPEVLDCFVGDSELFIESTKLEPPDDDENEEHLDDKAESTSEYNPEDDGSSSEEEETFKEGNCVKVDEKLKCPLCDKIFRTVANMNDHLNLHSDVKGFSCNECDKSFKTRRYLRKHKAFVHVFGDHECATCGMKFNKTSTYQSHLKSHSRTNKPKKSYTCSYCDKSFDHRNHWKSHELTHTGKRTHLCNICGKSFIYDSSLKRHLKNHLKIHNGDAEKYACTICSKTFSRKDSLKAHHDVHLNLKAYQCDQCGKQFVHQYTLKGHMKLHNVEKTHHCEFCQESYLRIRDLRRHRLLIHNKTKEINDQVIDQSLQEKKEVVIKEEENSPKNLRKRPREENPYCCDLCGKSYRIPSALGNHMKMHSKDRRYVCKACGHAFNNIVHLQQHVNAVHMKQKPYSCQVCKKSFGRNSDLNRHRKIHSVDKPYQCADCGKVYAWAMSLKNHIREHTGEKPFVCIICNVGFAQQNCLARHTRSAHTGVLINIPKESAGSEELAQNAS